MKSLPQYLMSLIVVLQLVVPSDAAGWKAGGAKQVITPPQFMPMAGYASRGSRHAESKLTELWAKACVLEDAAGERAAIVTLDLIGMERSLGEAICRQLEEQHGLKRHQISLCTSHTHTGPIVQNNLRPMYEKVLTSEDRKLVVDYSKFVEESVVDIVGQALKSLAPAEVGWTSGKATFAVNRRNNPEKEVPALREAGMLKGPFDHDVPVLAVRQAGKLTAVVFGYACHNTTLGTFEWSGDYAGFAQLAVEAAEPGCVALYWAGCGGDQNPLPRREVALAKKYGSELAAGVIAALEQGVRPLPAKLQLDYQEIDLDFDGLPTRADLERDANSSNIYVSGRATALLARLDAGKPLSPSYPYPIAVWSLGDEVTWVVLGGEVVVDYAVRIKDELGDEALHNTNVWVAAYSNDVMAYIPSRRVLGEGGYEGGGAMVYYGLPSAWAPDVEERIITEVHRQAKSPTEKPESR